jgi:hypothetical protein
MERKMPLVLVHAFKVFIVLQTRRKWSQQTLGTIHMEREMKISNLVQQGLTKIFLNKRTVKIVQYPNTVQTKQWQSLLFALLEIIVRKSGLLNQADALKALILIKSGFLGMDNALHVNRNIYAQVLDWQPCIMPRNARRDTIAGIKLPLTLCLVICVTQDTIADKILVLLKIFSYVLQVIIAQLVRLNLSIRKTNAYLAIFAPWVQVPL